MPLEPGTSEETVGHNISEMEKSGHPPKQAIAASLSNAGKSNRYDARYDAMKQRRDPNGIENDASDPTSDPVNFIMGGAEPTTPPAPPTVQSHDPVAYIMAADPDDGGSIDEQTAKGIEDQWARNEEILEETEDMPDAMVEDAKMFKNTSSEDATGDDLSSYIMAGAKTSGGRDFASSEGNAAMWAKVDASGNKRNKDGSYNPDSMQGEWSSIVNYIVGDTQNYAAPFREEDHPRANDGKFGDKNKPTTQKKSP